MLAHRDQRPCGSWNMTAGVPGRQAVGVEETAVGRRHPAVGRDSRLAHRDLAGRHVEHNHRAVRARQGGAEGIGAEPRLRAAERRLNRRVVDAVDEMDRGEAARCALLRPMADPPEVEAVADREQRDAGLCGPSHAELHRLVADHLAIAALALDHQDGSLLAHDLEMAVGDQGALGE